MPKKNKSKKTKNRRSRRNRSNKRTGKPGVSKFAHAVCSRVDPFCPAAYGSKRAAGSFAPTLSFSIKTVFTVTTGSGGDGFFVLYPGPNPLAIANLSPTTATFPGTTTPATAVGTFPAWAGQVRVVSAGIAWHDIAPRTAAGGNVVLVDISAGNHGLFDATAHSLSQLMNANQTTISDRRVPGTFVCKPRSNMQANEFLDITVPNDDDKNPWQPVLIYASGAASSVVLNVVVSVNYEVVPNESSIPGSKQSPAPAVEKAVDAYPGGYQVGNTDARESKVWDWAWRVGSNFAERGVNRIADIAFGSDGGNTTNNNFYSGSIMDVD